MKLCYFAITVWFICLIKIAPTHAESELSEEDAENLEQFSYQVSLRHAADNAHFCSGSILGRRHILTAAHCVHRPGSAKKKNHGEIRVVAAQLNLNTNNESIVRDVAKIIVHPKFRKATSKNDLAILVLKDPLDLSNPYISTVKLRSTEKMGNCFVSGWGTTNFKAQHEIFTHAKVVILSKPECQESYAERNVSISHNVICTKAEEICKGDSGGPLLCRGVLAGVTSMCGNSGYPGVHTNLIHMTKWINKITKSRHS